MNADEDDIRFEHEAMHKRMHLFDCVKTITIFLIGFFLGFTLDHFTTWTGPKPWPFG